jgi:hypothetical protein
MKWDTDNSVGTGCCRLQKLSQISLSFLWKSLEMAYQDCHFERPRLTGEEKSYLQMSLYNSLADGSVH